MFHLHKNEWLQSAGRSLSAEPRHPAKQTDVLEAKGSIDYNES